VARLLWREGGRGEEEKEKCILFDKKLRKYLVVWRIMIIFAECLG